MINKEWKDLFGAAMTLNLQLLDAVAETDKYRGEITEGKENKLKSLFSELHKKLLADEELDSSDILILGIALNIAHINIKSKVNTLQKALEVYEDTILPSMRKLGDEPTYEEFCKKFSAPIV